MMNLFQHFSKKGQITLVICFSWKIALTQVYSNINSFLYKPTSCISNPFPLAIYERYFDFKYAIYGEREKKNFLTELFALIYFLNLFKPTITLDCADVILIT